MINTVSDFLLNLKNKEQELLKKYDIVKHPGIIGDMYEGLTNSLLDKSVFEGLDLKIRAGKIRNSKNEFSGEIDCMIVVGEGESIPYTDKFIYDSSKVIAVIQVKKNLFSKDVKDSHENLISVVNVTEPRQGEHYHYRLLRDSWRLICQEELPPREEVKNLVFEKEMLYHVLVLEAFYPARIVWGYNGFKSEFTLREAFVDYIEDNISDESIRKQGFGPSSFPNLVICDKYSLIKTNGIPFAHPISEDYWWPFYVSSYDNPIYFLLEVIWTRLQYMFKLPAEIFGDDLRVDEMHGLLLGRCKEMHGAKGWEYFCVPASKKELERPLNHRDWQPEFLDKISFDIINMLCAGLEVDLKNNIDLQAEIAQNGYELNAFIDKIKRTALVDVNGQNLSLITEQCLCGMTADGRYFAGDNKTGRVTRWAMNEIAKSES